MTDKKTYREITVSDLMQNGYRYQLVEPIGENFDNRFKPELTPKEMLAVGVFGGKYMTDCGDEFPKEWYEGAKLCHTFHDPEINYFGVNASQSLATWREKGWIHAEDPRGWFQWYCRYFYGRRHEDDERQIRRWMAMRRHISQIKIYCEPRDFDCRRQQRQAVLHWAYDSRKY